MSWLDYFYLLEKYDGDLDRASREELARAARANPNDAEGARRLAEQKFTEKQLSLGLISLPKCPHCGGPMLFSMCFKDKEFVCLPCDYAVAFDNDEKEVWITKEFAKSLKKEWFDELHAIAMIHGGGKCIVKEETGRECLVCKNGPEKFEFKIWKSKSKNA